MMRERPIQILRFGLACAAVALISCARTPSAPPPPPQAPPPPRALTIFPQKGQSQSQQNKDNAECQTTASAHSNSSEGWTQLFTACMSGRGYGVQ